MKKKSDKRHCSIERGSENGWCTLGLLSIMLLVALSFIGAVSLRQAFLSIFISWKVGSRYVGIMYCDRPFDLFLFLVKLVAVRHFFWFGGSLGSAFGAEFPVSPSNQVGFTPRLLYSSTHHSP